MAKQSDFEHSDRPNEQILSELVRRIVDSVRPLRIILFGSGACGEMGPDSDLDLLVVMPDGVHRRRTAQAVYRSLRGLGVPKDVVVVTESDVRQYASNPSLILYQALRQGKELYHAAR
ncbi:MAG: nucleotidyltransferase domain-containing protein [Actinobacteria bacterium]|nr:nucleotidyltransferase domain-containing protein [Actinomycetota bacterium]MCG2818645.1 nucleotidyltransferase domain-containing protein [Actinomycetes bacterium]MBU4218166.1 nucleotidyltransferase domain-containing protein [Actinomycetota bacterium]MBU4358591.1 nucleotidyltransferase domain-containing protein [Actinomycetota bacterium]MBU4392094.1 nucleotidyltransferase domain-containing protein [Actinomycetota bacterium]